MKNITIKSLREKQKDVSNDAEKFFKRPKNDVEELEEKSVRVTKTRKVINFVFLFIFVLVVGGIGGILADRFALPYVLTTYPDLERYEILKRVNERTTIVEITKEVEISEDRTAIEAIKKVLPSVVHIVQISDESDKPVYNGSGIIATNDGLIITSLKNVIDDKEEEEINIKVELNDKSIHSAKLVKEDLLTGLAIIKIECNDLPVLAFAEYSDLELGEKLVIINSSVITDIISKFIDDYVARKATTEIRPVIQNRIKIINKLDDSFSGSPAVGFNGEIIGIVQSEDLIIPTVEIKALLREVLE